MVALKAIKNLLLTFAILIAFGIPCLAQSVDRNEKEVLASLNLAKNYLSHQQGALAVATLVRLRNETSYFYKYPDKKLTAQYVELYDKAVTARTAEEFLDSCAGNTNSLRTRASAYSTTAALSPAISCKLQRPVFNEILDLTKQAKKIVEAPENADWFAKNLKVSAMNQLALDNRMHTDFLGTPKVLGKNPLAKQMSQDQTETNRSLTDARNKANANSDLYIKELGEKFNQYIDSKLGIDKQSLNANKDKIAEQFHLAVMEGNRENCLSNYLFYTQNFDFSSADPIKKGDESRDINRLALDLFGKSAKLYGTHLVTTLPEFTCDDPPNNKTNCDKTEYYLSRKGAKALNGFQKNRKGAPPYTLDQVYQGMKSTFLELGKVGPKGMIEDPKVRQAWIVTNRKEKLKKLFSTNKYKFLLDTDTVKNALGKLSGVESPQEETLLKSIIQDALKEQVAKTKKYAIDFITPNQSSQDFWGANKTTWDYKKSAGVLLYSSPNVIQGVIGRSPQLLGAICEPMKYVTKQMQGADIPDYVMWGGGAMGVVPVVGNAAGLIFGLGLNIFLDADAAGKIAYNNKRNALNQSGENVQDVNYDQKKSDVTEAKEANTELEKIQKRAMFSMPAMLTAGLAFSGGVNSFSKIIPKGAEYVENNALRSFVDDAVVTTGSTVATNGVVDGNWTITPSEAAMNLVFARVGRKMQTKSAHLSENLETSLKGIETELKTAHPNEVITPEKVYQEYLKKNPDIVEAVKLSESKDYFNFDERIKTTNEPSEVEQLKSQKIAWKEFQKTVASKKINTEKSNTLLKDLYAAHLAGEPGTLGKKRALVEIQNKLKSYGFTEAEAKASTRSLADAKILGIFDFLKLKGKLIAEATEQTASYAPATHGIKWPQLTDNSSNFADFRTAYDKGKFDGDSKFISYVIKESGTDDLRLVGEVISVGPDGKSLIVKTQSGSITNLSEKELSTVRVSSLSKKHFSTDSEVTSLHQAPFAEIVPGTSTIKWDQTLYLHGSPESESFRTAFDHNLFEGDNQFIEYTSLTPINGSGHHMVMQAYAKVIGKTSDGKGIVIENVGGSRKTLRDNGLQGVQTSSNSKNKFSSLPANLAEKDLTKPNEIPTSIPVQEEANTISPNSNTNTDPSNFYKGINPTQEKLINSLDIKPAISIERSGTKLTASEPFEADGRIYSWVTVEVNGKKSIRLAYRSQSQGVFRMTDGIDIEGDVSGHKGWISKGLDGHAEQMMSIDPEMQQALLKKSESPTIKIFTKDQGIDQIEKASNDRFGLLRGQEKIKVTDGLKTPTNPPLSTGNRGITMRDPKDVVITNENLRPDFTKAKQTFTTKTATSGEVRAYVYESKDKSVEYLIYRDKDNKIWFADVVTQNVQVNKYGVKSAAVDFGELTTPRWEYTAQIPNKFEHTAGSFDLPITNPQYKQYSSSWKYLQEIPEIQNWYKVNGIPIPKD